LPRHFFFPGCAISQVFRAQKIREMCSRFTGDFSRIFGSGRIRLLSCHFCPATTSSRGNGDQIFPHLGRDRSVEAFGEFETYVFWNARSAGDSSMPWPNEPPPG